MQRSPTWHRRVPSPSQIGLYFSPVSIYHFSRDALQTCQHTNSIVFDHGHLRFARRLKSTQAAVHCFAVLLLSITELRFLPMVKAALFSVHSEVHLDNFKVRGLKGHSPIPQIIFEVPSHYYLWGNLQCFFFFVQSFPMKNSFIQHRMCL